MFRLNDDNRVQFKTNSCIIFVNTEPTQLRRAGSKIMWKLNFGELYEGKIGKMLRELVRKAFLEKVKENNST